MARIIILNLGSTSSKGAVYENLECLDEFTLRHSAEELKPFKRIIEQVDFRQERVEMWLKEHHYALDEMDVFCVRGGLVNLYPVAFMKLRMKSSKKSWWINMVHIHRASGWSLVVGGQRPITNPQFLPMRRSQMNCRMWRASQV